MIILAGLIIFAACGKDGGPHGTGGQNPLAECVVPSVIQAGEEALVQWNGFSSDARIWLVAEEGQEHEMSITVLTDSGLMFMIPASLPAGLYVLMLDQGGRKELGTIEVLAADIPVTGMSVPSGIVLGEQLIIDGIGFEEGCSIVLIDEEGNEYVAAATLTLSGVCVELPDEVAKGKYQLYLRQNGGSWLLAASFSIYRNGAKVLERIDYYRPYLNSSRLRLSWEIDREDPVTLTLSEYLVEGEEQTLQVYDQYVCDASGTFELTHDGFEESNDVEMTYTRTPEGEVTVADVKIYGKSSTTPFTWTYDADGYLVEISSPSNSFRSLDYTQGNLTSFRNTDFEYDDPQLVNNPYAPDVVWAYMAMMETFDPFVYIPYMLGWYTKASAQLPTDLILPSPTGTGTEEYPLTYIFDEEGYVVNMAWGSSEINFIFD